MTILKKDLQAINKDIKALERKLEKLIKGEKGGRVKARNVLCYWAVKELEMSGADIVRKLNISNSAASRSVERGEKIATEMKLKLIEN